MTCPPPRGNAWAQADARHVTCSACYDKCRERIAEIAERYLLLDARPGGSYEPGSRGAPGFGSRPPCALHVIAMRDPRSSQDSHVWVGGDGRVHAEQARPVLSVYGTLNLLCWEIAEHRDVSGPGDRDDVYELLRFVDRHLDYVTRHAELAVETDQVLRDLVGALRPVTGDARRRIGECSAEVPRDVQTDEPQDADAEVLYCGAQLYAPTRFQPGEEVVCGACGARYPMDEWLDIAAGRVEQQAS